MRLRPLHVSVCVLEEMLLLPLGSMTPGIPITTLKNKHGSGAQQAYLRTCVHTHTL